MNVKQKNEITQLISKNELEKAIQILIGIMEDKEELNQVIHLSARLNSLKRQERLSLLSFEEISRENNKITLAFLNLLDEIELEIEKEEKLKENNRGKVPNEKRLALVIGCNNYEFAGKLQNPLNDAIGIEGKLKKLGFDVILKENPNLRDMKMIVDDFGLELENYDIGLFYFAGHGVQVKGINYLIPIDANLRYERSVEYDCIEASRVLLHMENVNNKVNIMILDACRNNPFERSWGRGIDGNGLAVMNAPIGSIISYSTSPGKTASDGQGKNGLYTGALIEELGSDRSSITEMFQKVRRKVMNISKGEQIPWESTSLTDNFYMRK